MQLKKLYAICSAVLVAFSCSLVLAVISPAYAVSSVVDYKFTLFASPITYDPLWSSKAVDIPCGSATFYTWNVTTVPSAAGHIRVASNITAELDHSYTLLVDLGYDSSGTMSVDGSTRYSDLIYYDTGSSSAKTSSNAVYAQRALGGLDAHGKHYLYRVTVPAYTQHFSFNTPYKYRPTTANTNYLLTTFGAWVIDSTDDQLIDSIATIISQLREMNAELDTQTTIIRSINNYISNVDSNVTSIYDLLHEALAQESSEVDSKSQAVAESIMQQDNAEQFWNDKNQENFDALDLNNFSFSSGVVTALGTVGNLFTSIWNSLGDTVIIFTFPLMLGITLVAIGRVSRHGGKGKSGKGGGSE